jgi:hypothetical protein
MPEPWARARTMEARQRLAAVGFFFGGLMLPA